MRSKGFSFVLGVVDAGGDRVHYLLLGRLDGDLGGLVQLPVGCGMFRAVPELLPLVEELGDAPALAGGLVGAVVAGAVAAW